MTFSIKRLVLLYPFLLAALPVFFLASRNEVPLHQVIGPLAIVLVATLLLSILLRLFIKDISKVAVILSVVLVIFFSSGHMINIIRAVPIDIPIVKFSHVMLFVMFLGTIGAIAFVWGILRYKGSLTQPMHYFGIAVSFLVIFNVVNFALNTPRAMSVPVTKDVQNLNISDHSEPLGIELPDVYYIILDGYAREDVLNEVHGFDNNDFLKSLRQKGFYIASQSRANYNYTRFSLSSALNMRYLDDNDHVYELWEDNEVTRIAENMGYRVIQIQFDDTALQIQFDDTQIGSSGDFYGSLREALLTEFSLALLGSTMSRYVTPLENVFVKQEARIFHTQMRVLREIPEMREPTFSYIHFFPPHPPYIFDREGNKPEQTTYNWGSDNFKWDKYDLYIDQLLFMNKEIEVAVNKILEASSVEPIIIIQGDHGTRSKNRQSHLFISESTGILNAYYLPQRCKPKLYPTITPINTFRVVFDSCFGSDFGLLEDKSYFFRNRFPPYRFYAVIPESMR